MIDRPLGGIESPKGIIQVPRELPLFEDRIAKLSYCRSLVQNDEKLRQLEQYLAFLRKRDTLTSSNQSIWKSSFLLAKMLLAGDYHRYARHILSAGSDFFRAFKSFP